MGFGDDILANLLLCSARAGLDGRTGVRQVVRGSAGTASGGARRLLPPDQIVWPGGRRKVAPRWSAGASGGRTSSAARRAEPVTPPRLFRGDQFEDSVSDAEDSSLLVTSIAGAALLEDLFFLLLLRFLLFFDFVCFPPEESEAGAASRKAWE